MGLTDIFYNELNRFRDKASFEEERKEIVKRALKKSLTKFKFIWEQMLNKAYPRNQISPQFETFSEDFMNLAVEVNEILGDDEITNNLKEIFMAFKIVSKHPMTMGGYFDNAIPTEIGQSLARIDKINEKL